MEKLNIAQNKSVSNLVRFEDIGDGRQEKRKEDSKNKTISNKRIIMTEPKESEDSNKENNPDDDFLMGIF